MKIKIYNKFELAWLYYPMQSKHVAVNHLMRLINHCTPLVTAIIPGTRLSAYGW